MTFIRNAIAIGLAAAFLAGCGGQKPEAETLIKKVKLGEVMAADSVYEAAYPGSVSATDEINLAFKVAGQIAEIAVREGDYVTAGQLIARIDPRDYEIQMQVAQAQYDQVKAEAGRVTELYNRQSVAGNDYDKMVSGERMVTAQLKHAKDQLNDTHLYAPTSGFIQKINFSVNELINLGMPLATLISTNQLQAGVDIPVALFLMRNQIISYKATQPHLPNQVFDLKPLGFRKKANQNQLYRLQLAFGPEARTQLAAGMDILIHISYLKESHEAGLCVPVNALYHEGGKTFVWVYQPEKGQVIRHEVKTGALAGEGKIRISGEIRAGEKVVTAGVGQLTDYQKVEPVGTVSESNVGGML